jgi:hypothetical protein
VKAAKARRHAICLCQSTAGSPIGVEQTKRDLSRRDLDARQRKDVGGVEESSLPRLRPRGLVLAQ